MREAHEKRPRKRARVEYAGDEEARTTGTSESADATPELTRELLVQLTKQIRKTNLTLKRLREVNREVITCINDCIAAMPYTAQRTDIAARERQAMPKHIAESMHGETVRKVEHSEDCHEPTWKTLTDNETDTDGAETEGGHTSDEVDELLSS